MSKSKRPKPIKYNEKEFKALSGLWRIDRVILDTLDFKELTKEVVNVVLKELDYLKLGYQIIVLTLLNKKKKTVERVSISKTKAAATALEETPIPFKEIVIPLKEKENLLVKAVKNKKIYFTHDLSDVLYPEANRRVWRKIQKACNIKTSMIYPIVVRGKSIGAMIFSLSKGANKISKYEKEILAGFTNAVGIAVENATLYKRLKKTNKRLREVSALKDEFVSLTSHELRTPLTAIASSLSTVLDGYAGDVSGEAKEFLDGAHNESTRLLRLVNNLLNISRIESGRLKYQISEFELCQVVDKVVEGLQNQADEKNLQLLHFCQKDILLKADKDKVHEVLVNLVGNSLKFTDEGRVAITVKKQNNFVLAEVEDTGPGIHKKDQKKLFQKFERAGGDGKGKGKSGTGLGLYICKTILEGMDGAIWFESAEGKGTTFYFILPLV